MLVLRLNKLHSAGYNFKQTQDNTIIFFPRQRYSLRHITNTASFYFPRESYIMKTDSGYHLRITLSYSEH